MESGDETDDDEQPNKPIPQWAKNPALMNKVKYQGLMMINFTKLFRSSANSNIVLEDIFKIKRKNFTERSSSAFWSSPPVWRTNGLTGDESFRRMKWWFYDKLFRQRQNTQFCYVLIAEFIQNLPFLNPSFYIYSFFCRILKKWFEKGFLFSSLALFFSLKENQFHWLFSTNSISLFISYFISSFICYLINIFYII